MSWRNPFRFSLRFKVMSIVFIVMIVVLIVSNTLYYLTTKRILERRAFSQNTLISQQIQVAIEQSQSGQKYVDDLIGNELRIASIAIENRLSPDANQVSNEQLSNLASDLGITAITLFQPKNGDFIGVKSSDPKEIGLSTKSMTLWFRAFNDLWNGDPYKHSYGTAEPNFWSGPISNATSDPTQVDKWGYYYDGSTNYIIDPFISTASLTGYLDDVGAQVMINHLLQTNHNILSIAVLNKSFGHQPIKYVYKGQSWVDINNQPIMYGKYEYANEALDVASKEKAYNTGKTVGVMDVVNGQRVLKSFVPETFDGDKYVVEVVSDYNSIRAPLEQQFHMSVWISLAMLVLIVLLSRFTTRFVLRPIRQITHQVDEIASGNFSTEVKLPGRDELTVLSDRVNRMSRSLLGSLHEMARKERGLGVQYLMVTAQSLSHEINNPLVSIRYLVDFLPKIQDDLSERGQEVLLRIKTASDYASQVVREFSDFLKNGQLRFAQADMIEIVQGAIDVVRPIAEEHDVSIAFSYPESHQNPLFVNVDREKMQMVIVNLLRNGIDATASSDRDVRQIQVTLLPHRDTIQIDVEDSGHGIPREKWEDVFKPYHSTKETGLGLGLTLCGFVVLAHGGIIGVQDSNSEGTTMRITLPRN